MYRCGSELTVRGTIRIRIKFRVLGGLKFEGGAVHICSQVWRAYLYVHTIETGSISFAPYKKQREQQCRGIFWRGNFARPRESRRQCLNQPHLYADRAASKRAAIDV